MNVCIVRFLYYSVHEYYAIKLHFAFFFLAVDGGWEMGLRVSASSRVSIYSLWDYAGVHCNKGNVLYRHSFIDNLTNIRNVVPHDFALISLKLIFITYSFDTVCYTCKII
jgi:hypothetical protein